MTAQTTSSARAVPRQEAWGDDSGDRSGGAHALWAQVVQTRSTMASSRGSVNPGSGAARSRREHRDALLAYTNCLLALRRPVPYQLRDELRLLQLTCAVDDPR